MKLIVFLLPALLFAQKMDGQKTADSPAPNIVPNPGFELLKTQPIGWFYKGAHFGEVVKYWFSATTSSPDAYSPKVHVPDSWAAKGFGLARAHGGKNMAGITVFGCVNGKPHCREYIEILLTEPLVVGQTYLVEFWVASLPKSLQINQLGARFSLEKIERKTDEQLLDTPQIRLEKVNNDPARWFKISGKFVAEEEAEWLTIGNFFTDEQTVAEPGIASGGLNFAYYYIDDVLVKKVPPIKIPPVKPDDLTKIRLEEGKIVRLKSIHFEFDKDELLPRSFVELNKLLQILKENPSMAIQIIGHTDSDGSANYNLELSKNRAKTVVDWLKKKGISPGRLTFKGEGEADPIASNDNEPGKQLNRRVEFLILKK